MDLGLNGLLEEISPGKFVHIKSHWEVDRPDIITVHPLSKTEVERLCKLPSGYFIDNDYDSFHD